MMKNIIHKIMNYFTLRELAAITFMIIAVIISCMEYNKWNKSNFVFWEGQVAAPNSQTGLDYSKMIDEYAKDISRKGITTLPYTDALSSEELEKLIPPDWQSTKPIVITILCAVLFVGSIFARRLTPDSFSVPSKLVLFIVNSWFIASFISIYVSKEQWNIPIINISSWAFLVMTIMFSWLGMCSIARHSWILLIFGSLSHTTFVNKATGTWGVIYILCGCISLVLQGDYESFVSRMKQDIIGVGNRVSIDINEAKNTTFEYFDKVKKIERNNFGDAQFSDTGTSALDSPKWYYADNGQQYGPFTETKLAGFIKSGVLTPETLVYNAYDVNFGNNWIAAKDTKLANFFRIAD
ncbi:MAG: DUF4339 domain-containing protein [Synergistaceae bacterium]|jgi:hypothetical protein|nr:DUF4339 domain-containing protein [Synergistaceae bacterium]